MEIFTQTPKWKREIAFYIFENIERNIFSKILNCLSNFLKKISITVDTHNLVSDGVLLWRV